MESFISHVCSIRPDLAASLVAIDGKTVRYSFDHGDPSNSIHLISTREVRGETSIEDCCQRVLEVTFDEDHRRARKGTAAEDLALMRKRALNLL